MARRAGLVPYLAAGLLIGLVSPIAQPAPPAHAAPNVKVTITIERIKSLTGGEGACGELDWYVEGSINGQRFGNLDSPGQDLLEGHNEIAPEDGWPFSNEVDLASLATPTQIPFSIEAREEDDGLCFGNEQYDISPPDQRPLTGFIFLNHDPCTVHDPEQTTNPPNFTLPQGLIGDCGTSITQSGTAEDERALIIFRITVDAPPSADGIRIRCMHTPVWPQPERPEQPGRPARPAQPVTITATALDGALQTTILADDLEIWVDPNAEDQGAGTRALDAHEAMTLTHTFTPPTGTRQFGYGCRLREAGRPTPEIFTGWRRVTVGDPFTNFATPKPALPILYTAPRSGAVDIVFIPDRDTYNNPADNDYPGASDTNFQTDVAAVINTAFYDFEPFLTAQDKFNFWILIDNPGQANDANAGCDHEFPVLWEELATFVESGVILHRKAGQRDCAKRGDKIVSGEIDPGDPAVSRPADPEVLRVVTHEIGHSPFGLADEYCPVLGVDCDGGYFEQEVNPNVYERFADCADVAETLGRPRNSCRLIHDSAPSSWFDNVLWFTSEPDVLTPQPRDEDVMNDNGPVANALDRGRYDLWFGDCANARC